MFPRDHTSPVTRAIDEPRTILCLDSDPEYPALLKTAYEHRDDLTFRIETDPAEAATAVEHVDCVVSANSLDGSDGPALFETIRAKAPTMPFVLHTGGSLDAVADELRHGAWTDALVRGWSKARVEQLVERIYRLVTAHRLDTLSRRYCAALDSSRQATLVVAPSGAIEFANPRLGADLQTDRSQIIGRHWSTVFTDGSAEKLRTSAVPVVEKGWRWTGETLLSRQFSDASSRQTCLTRTEDGSLVFSFHRLD
jgi:DNA-binding NtrC family response regulator